MKEIIELPDELLTYVKEKATDLANASLLLFEYILVPRNNYVEVTPEMRPRITDKIISYTIQNILGVLANPESKYTINFDNAFKVSSINSEYSINDLFISLMSERLRNTLSFLIPDNSSVIDEKGISVFKLYVEHVLNEALYTLSEGNLDMNINDILKKHKNIAEYLIENTITEGDNVIYPKSYGFNNDDDNVIVQSFVWLMCGLNDWLDKDYIDEDDVKYMSKIMFSGLSSDMLSSEEVSDDVKVNIKEALFLSDFFTSDKAANLMSKLFSNIKENYNNDNYSKRVKQFSIVI
jgi:hypothetical protein